MATIDVLDGHPSLGGQDLQVYDEVDELAFSLPNEVLHPNGVGIVTGGFPLSSQAVSSVRPVLAVLGFQLLSYFSLCLAQRLRSGEPCRPRYRRPAPSWCSSYLSVNTSLGAWPATLFVFVDRHRASVSDSAVRPGLRRVEHCAAMASPCHMSGVAGAPDRADRPTGVALGVAVQAARRRHDHPAALGVHEVADEVVRELVATFGHRDVVCQATDNNLGSGLLTPMRLLRVTIER
jgi:hypothetical protein